MSSYGQSKRTGSAVEPTRAKPRSLAGISSNPYISKFAAKAEKKTIDYLDWKESFFYKHLIVRHESDDETFEKDHFIRSDDFDFLLKTIKGFRSRKPTCKESELYQMLPPMMRKANATICFILKEILGEGNYKIEYD